ncbi:MAG: [FeFe] hydrogenase H-cluster radical SAM maturase HydE [Oscillospiraceae bacterium]|nr:[FeFe] hydrogenase H-cluster radical SAM maturase HydE [Oscillospiraceae bacterium]
MTNTTRIHHLFQSHSLPRSELRLLLESRSEADAALLFQKARETRERVYGKAVWLRGLIEISNHCKNDCLYCGLRRSNEKIERYRLCQDEILSCCGNGYAQGLRSFVLQGGEDPAFTDGYLIPIVEKIRAEFPGCAITLSLGERGRDSYEGLYRAGADRCLLRHETANEAHYAALHPPEMRLNERLDCLRSLKEIGYQVGCGFMVGTPGQSVGCLLDDLEFLAAFRPHMVGIGPFIPHQDTPFAREPRGSLGLTLFLLGLTRLLLPEALIPATTALGSIHPQGRELGLRAGANILMPNITPAAARAKYAPYDNKIATNEENAVVKAGYFTEKNRGDHIHV